MLGDALKAARLARQAQGGAAVAATTTARPSSVPTTTIKPALSTPTSTTNEKIPSPNSATSTIRPTSVGAGTAPNSVVASKVSNTTTKPSTANKVSVQAPVQPPPPPPPKCNVCLKLFTAQDPPLVFDSVITLHKSCAKCSDCRCQLTTANFAKQEVGDKFIAMCKFHYAQTYGGGAFVGNKVAVTQTQTLPPSPAIAVTPAQSPAVVDKAISTVAPAQTTASKPTLNLPLLKPELVPPPFSSAPSSSSAATSSVPTTSADDERFAKYAKMVSMNIPEGAIRGRMKIDAMSDADTDLFFKQHASKSAAQSSTTTKTTGNDLIATNKNGGDKLSKYVDMLNAIRSKMIADGIPDAEIETFLLSAINKNKSSNQSASASTATATGPLAKYVQMQKMNIPEGAIRGRMTVDGISAADQDAFFSGKPIPSSTPELSSLQSLGPLAKYVQMQKMNIPEGAIRGRMTVDGVSAGDQDAFFTGKPIPSLQQAAAQAAPRPGGFLADIAAGPKLKSVSTNSFSTPSTTSKPMSLMEELAAGKKLKKVDASIDSAVASSSKSSKPMSLMEELAAGKKLRPVNSGSTGQSGSDKTSLPTGSTKPKSILEELSLGPKLRPVGAKPASPREMPLSIMDQVNAASKKLKPIGFGGSLKSSSSDSTDGGLSTSPLTPQQVMAEKFKAARLAREQADKLEAERRRTLIETYVTQTQGDDDTDGASPRFFGSQGQGLSRPVSSPAAITLSPDGTLDVNKRNAAYFSAMAKNEREAELAELAHLTPDARRRREQEQLELKQHDAMKLMHYAKLGANFAPAGKLRHTGTTGRPLSKNSPLSTPSTAPSTPITSELNTPYGSRDTHDSRYI